MYKETFEDNDLKETDIQSEMSQIVESVSDGIENIFMPQKGEIKHCFFKVKLLNHQEASNISKRFKIDLPSKSDSDFFIYDKQISKIFPFNKNDFLISQDGYFRCTGKDIFCYDSFGNEIGSF
ncbi:hypothetical protein K9M48_00870 [Candidatus Gracilibacteria bacterium]|nr:hypothetical protein [Candidatus Gracilibacteria bacterium]